MSLELLTRRRCPLCDQGEAIARSAAKLIRTELVILDVDDDPGLAVDYGLRVPVIRDSDGLVLAEGVIRLWPLLGRVGFTAFRRARSKLRTRRSRNTL